MTDVLKILNDFEKKIRFMGDKPCFLAADLIRTELIPTLTKNEKDNTAILLKSVEEYSKILKHYNERSLSNQIRVGYYYGLHNGIFVWVTEEYVKQNKLKIINL